MHPPLLLLCPVQSEDVTSAEATPLRPSELPAIGAVVLDSPCVQQALPVELHGDSDSGGSSFDVEGSLSPGKLCPADYELLRVVGQGAFGKVHPGALPSCMHACRSLCLHLHWRDDPCVKSNM